MATESNHRMAASRLSRRDFLQATGGMVGGAWLALHWPAVLAAAEGASAARASGDGFRQLSAAEAAGLEAIAARIIPSDGTPGAREAGVIHFIDRALGEFMADSAGMLREGLASLDTRAEELAGGGTFAGLDAAAQDALLGDIEETPFFGLMHFLTIAGMFAMPDYGGNRGHAGWKLLGFDHRHGWQPPFGHYDSPHAALPGGEESGGGHQHG